MESLYNQTLRDAEFILVFDGENKGLLSICETYRKRDNRFKIFIQPHLGVSNTRNFGIKQASGEFLTFVDADDSLYRKDSLENCFSATIENDSDIFIFDWASNSQPVKNIWSHSIKHLSKSEIEFCLQQTIYTYNSNFPGAPWAKFFRRKFITENKIQYKERCIIGQDRVFNYEAFSIAQRVSYSQITLYRYTTNVESATQQFRPNYLSIILNYIEELYFLAKDKYPSLIGNITITMFYYSWDKCYMNTQNKCDFFSRMSDLTKITKSDNFQMLIRQVNIPNISLLVKLEIFLLQHQITFWIYVHGLKKLLITKFRNTFY
jgi:glycosyltransferase involved in cell wall biosynthesis